MVLGVRRSVGCVTCGRGLSSIDARFLPFDHGVSVTHPF